MLFSRIKSSSVLQIILRYVAEFIIIFLGITFSFLFDQWREERQQKDGLIALSESLLNDVEYLKEKLKNDLQGSTEWIAELDSLRINRTLNRISEPQLLWFYKLTSGQETFLFDPHSPTYLSAIGSGLASELPETIMTQLYQVYQVKLPFFQLVYDQQKESIAHFRNNTIIPANAYLYSNEASHISLDLQKFTHEMQRPVYGNFINQVIVLEKTVYKVNENAFEALTALEDNLCKYIMELKE